MSAAYQVGFADGGGALYGQGSRFYLAYWRVDPETGTV